MQLHRQARAERPGADPVAHLGLTRPSGAVIVLASAVAALTVVDVTRQARLGMADTGTWFAAAATLVALAAALLIGRWPERRRTAVLMLAWLLAGIATDAGPDWPYSRLAVTAGLLATALQPALYAHMTLSYPSGRVRDTAERALLCVAYAITLLWQLAPALFADFGCAGCSPHVPSLLFTGHVLDLTLVGKVFSALIIAVGVAFLVLIARRLHESSPAARRTLVPLVLAGAFGALNSSRYARRPDRLEPGLQHPQLDRPDHPPRRTGSHLRRAGQNPA